MVDRTLIRPPCGRMGPITPEERKNIIASSPVLGQYDETVDRESASELLARRAARSAETPASRGDGRPNRPGRGSLSRHGKPRPNGSSRMSPAASAARSATPRARHPGRHPAPIGEPGRWPGQAQVKPGHDGKGIVTRRSRPAHRHGHRRKLGELSPCLSSPSGPAGRAFRGTATIVVATSTPVDFSMPSRPGDELTSITTGPRFDRSMSTPHTLRPMALAARMAVARSSGVILISSARPPRCRLERKSPLAPGSLHGRNDLAADDQSADVAAFGFLDELLHQDGDFGAVEGLDHRLRRFVGFAEHHADALRAFEQLDDHRRAADDLDDLVGAPGVVGERGDRQADAVAGEDLQGAQLVARAADGHRFVERKDAHHLELPQHGEAVEGVRRGNARNDRIEARQLLAEIAEFRAFAR